MVTDTRNNSGLAFVVGALIVVAAILGYFYMGGGIPNANASGINVKIEQPSAGY